MIWFCLLFMYFVQFKHNPIINTAAMIMYLNYYLNAYK